MTCPVCGEPRKLYVRVTRRKKKNPPGSTHLKGEKRTRRELRDTCGKKRCQAIQRGRTLAQVGGGAA